MSTGKKSSLKNLLRFSGNVLDKACDAVLWTTVYFAHMATNKHSIYTIGQSAEVADRFIEQLNEKSYKNALTTAKRKGFIKKSHIKRNAPPAITSAGRKRLATLIPHYDNKRLWDHRLYLITYDIATKYNRDRDQLRGFVKSLGATQLQKSIWVTPYNPKTLLSEFITTHHIHGSIIVSDIGKDGAIGDEDITTLLIRIYYLEEINNRYKRWIRTVQKKQIDSLDVLRYFAILADDPQLPFDLLPNWWKGDDAYKIVSPYLPPIK